MLSSVIELDDLSKSNQMLTQISSTRSQGSSSFSGSASPTSQHTTTSMVRGSVDGLQNLQPSCAVHLTPVEAIDPAFKMSKTGSSFAEYHRKFGIHGRPGIEDDDVSGSGRRLSGGPRESEHWLKIRVFEKVVLVASVILIILTFPLSMLACCRVVRHYERLVVLRMGRIRRKNPTGPGTTFVIPCVDSADKIDMRISSFDIKSTDIMLADSVQVRIDAVIWYRVICPLSAVVATDDYRKATHKLSIGMIRRFLGYKTLSDVVSRERDFNEEVKAHINLVTLMFGVRIERMELKTIRLEERFKATMAIEGTTYAQERGRCLLSQGELDSAPALVQAADRLTTTQSSQALMIRFMHTAIGIARKSEDGTTVFPVPVGWDWDTLLKENEKQRQLWIKLVREGKEQREADEKEKRV